MTASVKKLIKALAFVVLAIIFVCSTNGTTPVKDPRVDENTPLISYNQFVEDLDSEQILYIYYESNKPVFYVEKTDNSIYGAQNPEYDTFKKDILEKGIEIKALEEIGVVEKEKTPVILTIAHFLAIGLAMLNLIVALCELAHEDDNGSKRVVSVGDSKATSSSIGGSGNRKDNSVKTFDDIAGLREVKKDVRGLVDFLKNNSKYVEAGAVLPRGVIFYGPPGTGKTLLAKAIANEAGVPFHYMSGSDFIELYVGVGARRVRELFEKAKKQTPCIIFIDEIDTIGGKRGDLNDSGGENRKTLNALLAEMDGFDTKDNILVIGATNRIEDLDDALLRPGRFTNKFCVPVPETAKERVEVLKIYAHNKKLAEDLSLEDIASQTIGFSPAALEALLNEATIISIQDDKRFVDKESVDKAMFKVLLSGHVKEDQTYRDEDELLIVAWHEAGHALIGKLNGKKVPKVTILASTSGAGGVTFSAPSKTKMPSLADLKAEVRELYAGRAAELILANGDREKVTVGACNDIERATEIIRNIVSFYGMSDEYGLLNMGKLKVKQENLLTQEVALAKELEKETLKLLMANKDKLVSIVAMLLQYETIYEDTLDSIMNPKKIDIP